MMNVLQYPDVLTKPGRGQAATAAEWLAQCRPWLMSTILREEYGALPPLPHSMDFRLARMDSAALAGRATVKEIDIITKSPAAALRVLLITPNNAPAPVPCFLGLNFGGNEGVEQGRDAAAWPVQTIIARGYALATLHNGDAVPDDAALAKQRLADFVPAGKSPDDGDAPGTLMCWAWGLSRALDALEREPGIDCQRVAFMGHSRNGKAALLATALDPRPAAAIICQSGCGGMGPSRDIGEEWSMRETVEQITQNFPHWFCKNFQQYAAAPALLPFEQNALVALCAPRPVLLSSAAGDLWANPAGSFEMLLAADPVYRLFGAGGINPQPMPPVGELVPSRLGYFCRAGGHSVTPEDWAAWLAYADRWLAPPTEATEKTDTRLTPGHRF